MADQPTGGYIRGYQIIEQVHTGLTGSRYQAIQPGTDREVAIKVIKPRFANQRSFIQQFCLAAERLACLDHPHILPLLDAWRDPSGAYLVTPWMASGSLQTGGTGQSQGLEAAVRFLEQIGGALAYTHQHGVVHQDLKPGNIFHTPDGNLTLTGFGLAKQLAREIPPTHAAQIKNYGGYRSPEQISGAPPNVLGDIFSLGLVLFEILTGQPGRNWEVVGWTGSGPLYELPALQQLQPELPEALDAVIQRAAAHAPAERYATVAALAADFFAAAALPDPAPVLIHDRPNPYPGMRAFAEAEAAFFCGRTAAVKKLVVRMREEKTHFMALVGSSGSGKTSLLQAGLVPTLRAGAVPGSSQWVFTKCRPGTQPLADLEQALLAVAPEPISDLAGRLNQDAHALITLAQDLLPDSDSRLCLVIDGLEALFLQTADLHQQAQYLALLAAAAASTSPVYVLAALDAAVYDQALEDPSLGPLLAACTAVILPPGRADLLTCVEKPAEQVGVEFEPGLANQIIQDHAELPAALPRLQDTLAAIFRQRKSHALTAGDYTATGGNQSAAERGEAIYAQLAPKAQTAAQQTLLQMVTLPGGGAAHSAPNAHTRYVPLPVLAAHAPDPTSENQLEQPAARPKPAPDLLEMLAAFQKAGLVIAAPDPVTRTPTMTLAHPALLQAWGRLGKWAADSQGTIQMRRNLEQRTALWEASGNVPEHLLRGSELDRVNDWLSADPQSLNQAEAAFLEASRVVHNQELAAANQAERRAALAAARSRRFLQAMVGLFALVAIAAILLASRTGNQRDTALDLMETAAAAQGAALAQAATAQAGREMARIQGGLSKLSAENARQQLAEAEAQIPALATQQATAAAGAQLAYSRELAAIALNSLSVDPERGILLSYFALQTAYTREAENALRASLPADFLLAVFSEHSGPIHQVAVSPDGAYLASAGADGTVLIWDLASGTRLYALPGSGAAVLAAAFSPEGSRLATGGADGLFQMWLLLAGTGQQMYAVPGHDAAITSLAFSPDGSTLASGARDGSLVIWEADDGREQRTLTPAAAGDPAADQPGVRGLAYTPSGEGLAVLTPDGSIQIWEPTSGTLLHSITDTAASVLALSPDGEQLAAGSPDGLITLWQLSEALQPARNATIPANSGLTGLAFNPNGSFLASSAHSVQLWEANTGRLIRTFSTTSGDILTLAFAPDRVRLATGGTDGTVRLWSLAPGAELFTLPTQNDSTNRVFFSPDSTRLVATSNGPAGGSTQIYHFSSGRMLKSFNSGLAALSPNGRWLAGADGKTITLWDASEYAELDIFNAPANVSDLAFQPEGDLLGAGTADGQISVWNARTGELVWSQPGHTGRITQVDFSGNGRWLASSGADGNTSLWDLATAETFAVLPSGSIAQGAVFSPDSSLLAIPSANGQTTLWDLQRSEPVDLASIQTPGSTAAAFSPDGALLAVGRPDGQTTLWDVQATLLKGTGQPAFSLFGHSAGVTDIAFSPDGVYIATSSLDGTTRVYLRRVDNLVGLARTRITRWFTPTECRELLHMNECPPVP